MALMQHDALAQVVSSSAQVVSSSVEASALVVSSFSVVGVSGPVANSQVVSPLLKFVIKASCVSSIKVAALYACAYNFLATKNNH